MFIFSLFTSLLIYSSGVYVFITPLCFYSNFWWLVHSLMVLSRFIFMFGVYSYSDFNIIRYFSGVDYFSFMLICSLMLTARGSVYVSSYHSKFFYFYYFVFNDYVVLIIF